MAQVFAEAVACLVRERDDQFLQRIAVDYSLNLEELRTKYLAVAEAAIKVPRKYKKREPKDVKTTDEAGQATKCQGITAKKEPCKFSALKGECYCKRHLEKAAAESGAAAPKPVQVPTPAPAPPAEDTETRLAAILQAAEEYVPEDSDAELSESESEPAGSASCCEEEYEDEE